MLRDICGEDFQLHLLSADHRDTPLGGEFLHLYRDHPTVLYISRKSRKTYTPSYHSISSRISLSYSYICTPYFYPYLSRRTRVYRSIHFKSITFMPMITTCLWSSGNNALEMTEFYTSIFPASTITTK